MAHAAPRLMLSKGLPHYAREMEYYYQKPRPEILKELLPVFSRNGALGKSENRLMLAAFLAELVRKNQIKPQMLVDEANSLGKDARHTVAWCIHLAQTPGEKEYLGRLLNAGEKYLLAQILHSPASLAAWNIRQEKSVLQMYWAAFMASGNSTWLERIIDLALQYARSGDPGRHADADFATGEAAAASLYDFAPRHPLVAQRLKSRLPAKSPGEQKMIFLILEHAGK